MHIHIYIHVKHHVNNNYSTFRKYSVYGLKDARYCILVILDKQYFNYYTIDRPGFIHEYYNNNFISWYIGTMSEQGTYCLQDITYY